LKISERVHCRVKVATLRKETGKKEKERGSRRRYSNRTKKISLSLLSLPLFLSLLAAGPLSSRAPIVGGPPVRLVSVTNDTACSPLDVIRYQQGRSSLTRAGAGTLARRDSAECSRYDSREEFRSCRCALAGRALDDRPE